MKRDCETSLDEWLRRDTRKPLIIRGARQVGKSTAVRQFAASQGIALYEINLEKHTGLDPIFARFDVPQILKELELAIGMEIKPGAKGILFLDEIQATPHAIAALRYFYEDRRDLAVIAAGSLLEFAMARQTFSMPVGRVEYLYMGPMGFQEYLSALGESQLVNEIERFTPSEAFLTGAHERLLMRLRDFMLVGGMPEAVASYVAGGSLLRAPAVHQGILDTYRDDFGKYASGEDLARLRRVMEYAAAAVGDKVKYVNINPQWRAAEVRHAIDLLARANIICPVHHSDASGIPLGATADDTVFRLLFLDVGLMNAAYGVTALSLETFKEKRFVNEGRMAEQFVGQHLLHAGPAYQRPTLFYWLREGKKGNAEVDFLLQCAGRIVPVEVKAGAGGSLKSLHQFVAAKDSPVALRFDLNPPSVQTVEHAVVTPDGRTAALKYRLCSLPLYMVEQASRIVAQM